MIEKRHYSRKILNAGARILLCSRTPNRLEEGRAMVRNISPNGALISDVELPIPFPPLTNLDLAVIIEEGTLRGINITCSIARRADTDNGQISLGLKIDKIGEKHLSKIWAFVSPYNPLHNAMCQ